MNKKIISVVLSFMCLLTTVIFAQSAYASNVLVKTKGDVHYSFTIPADTHVPYKTTQMKIGDVKPTELLIERSKCVNVTVESQNNYAMVRSDGKSKIKYQLKTDGNMTFDSGDTDKSIPVYIQFDEGQWLQAKYGKHTDVLTFKFTYSYK